MGEMQGKAQLPMAEITAAQPPAGETTAFEEGLELGRRYAEQASRRIAAWAEEHPGQLLLAGLLAGLVVGKLLFPRRSAQLQDFD
ncbi:MAG TPA: hypothetical protein VFL36_05420 [Myxococcales bacterium]|nr:hypothetical protein [Myxococcales bacterium]